MLLEPVHISYSPSSSDGGIAVSISQLLEAQQSSGIFSRWLNFDSYSLLSRDSQLKSSIDILSPNILHLHGLWRAHTRLVASFQSSSIPFIISPHGMMDSWAMAHSPLKKLISLRLWESKAFRKAACIHALCAEEALSIRHYFPEQPIAVIPNGIKLPSLSPRDLPPPLWHEIIPPQDKVLLYLGRYHHKKGLEPLLTAWQSLADEATRFGWWLCFVGYGDDGKLQSQLSNFPISRCFAFGPAYNETKFSSYQHASAFILPSYSEGLPMAALEAMSFSLPCLLSAACNLPDAFSLNAALIAEPDTSSLTHSLRKLFHLNSSSLSAMGASARALVSGTYDWATVTNQFALLYGWVLGKNDKPSFII